MNFKICTNMRDAQNSEGIWVRDYSIATNTKGTYNRIMSLSRDRWNNILGRCNNDSASSKKRPTYVTCKNLFKDFHNFVEWSREQVGYNLLDPYSGNFRLWAIDKDILKIGNKVYSEDTCLFVPCKINSFMTGRGNFRGYLPIGVHWHKPLNKYRAQISENGKRIHLGYFNDPYFAHKAWQEAKTLHGKQLAVLFEHLHPQLAKGLQNICDLISEDVESSRITTIFDNY